MQLQLNHKLKLLSGLYIYWFLLIVWLAVWAALIWSNGNVPLFLKINGNGLIFLDALMPVLTHVGDGLFYIAVALLFFLFKKWRKGLFILFTYAVSGLIAQLLKRNVFPTSLRPRAYFEQTGEAIRQIEGVELFSYNSFPSGHSTSVFALALALVIIYHRPSAQFLLIVFAIIASFTRVYIAQHFPSDIWAGAVLGTFCTLLVYLFFPLYQHDKNPLFPPPRQSRTS